MREEIRVLLKSCEMYCIACVALVQIILAISETSAEEGACKANGGENCIFPFTYDDITYKECTWTESFWYNNDAWCAIEVDETTHEVIKFDNCGPDCHVAPCKLLLKPQHNSVIDT